MKYRNYGAILTGLIAALASASAQNHPFTVRDDIAMVQFSDPYPRSAVPGSDVVPRSPDGRYFALVTTRGILKSDQIESQISIFDVDAAKSFVESKVVRSPPAPRVIATIVGSSHYEASHPSSPVINDLHWSADMRRIYFKGENAVGAYQIYVAKVDGSGFRALTPPTYSVGRFDVEDNTIAYTASLLGAENIDRGVMINQDALMVTGYELRDIVFPGQLSSINPETFSLWVMKKSQGGWTTRQIADVSFRDERYLSFLYPFKLSPQGDKLIALTPVTAVPALWDRYSPAVGYEYLRLRSEDPRLTRGNNLWKPQEYSLIDLASGKRASLLGAPNARTLAYLDNNRLVWAADEKRVLVTNTFLPLDQGTPAERSERISPCAVASVDIFSLDAHCLSFNELQAAVSLTSNHVLDVAFGPNDNEVLFLVDHGSGRRTEEKYSFRDTAWKLTASTSVTSTLESIAAATMVDNANRGDFQLTVRQGLNNPPTLWAQDGQTMRTRELWNPNPRFAHMEFGNVSVYRWKDKTGREWSGGLVKPVGYMPERRYPLVIQMYEFYDGQFMTDGTDPTAFAAREMASAGFMVLQIQKKPDTLTDADPEIHLEGYRSAIETLSDANLIDSNRVGVVGFSWTSWYVEYALIKAPHLFTAATIADGLDNSYMGYLIDVGSVGIQKQMEKIHGAKPFGDGLKRWVEMAPSFHLDNVQTPLRIEAINPLSVLGEWELYSSLRSQNKPVDLIYFPHGTHIHQKPLERLESQQGDVDWMRFWLQGYEDPDPAKKDQYERWQRLKELQDADAKSTGQVQEHAPKPN